MTSEQQYQELPLVKDRPLPYTLLFVPESSLLFRVSFVVFFLSLAGMTTPWVVHDFTLLGVFAGIAATAGTVVTVFAVRTFRRRRKAKRFLRTKSVEMIEAIHERYGVLLTETILYSLVQGGSTVLFYEKSNVRVLMLLGSDPATKRTIMVTPTDILEE